MNTFRFVLATPDGKMYEGDIIKVSLRGAEGDLAVMAGHIPFVTSVKPCECSIYLDNNTIKKVNVSGGLLSVNKDSVNLMSGAVEWIN